MGPVEGKKLIPSWQRWPPNCCQTCTGWSRIKDIDGINSEWIGRCNQSSINAGDITDARFRCQDFKRKSDG